MTEQQSPRGVCVDDPMDDYGEHQSLPGVTGCELLEKDPDGVCEGL